MKLRIGILSTASIVPRLIGAVRAAEVYLSDSHSPYEGFTVSSIASRSLKNARQKALLWNVPKAFGSYEELIESGEADVIYIAMINSEHYHYAKLALEAGRHVLCEKPFTLEPSQAEELFALRAGRAWFLMEMQKVVFLPVVRQIKDLIQRGGFGRITWLTFPVPLMPGTTAGSSTGKGGGPLYGNAGYSLQLMQYLLDCYAAEWTGLCTRSQSGVEDQFSLAVRMENDTLYANKTSIRTDTIHTGYIYGEKGYIELTDYWKAQKAILHYKDRETEILEAPCEYELMYEVIHAEQCIPPGTCGKSCYDRRDDRPGRPGAA